MAIGPDGAGLPKELSVRWLFWSGPRTSRGPDRGEDDRPRRSKFDRNDCVAASATQTATSPRWRRSEGMLLEVSRYPLGTPQGRDIWLCQRRGCRWVLLNSSQSDQAHMSARAKASHW